MDSKTVDNRDRLIFSIGVTAGFLATLKQLEISNDDILNLRDKCFELSIVVVNEIREVGRINIKNLSIYCKELFKLYESIQNINEVAFYNVKRKKDEDISNRINTFQEAIRNIDNIINT